MYEESAEKINILIVDDTPHNIQLAANMLSKEGYRIAFDEDGESALQRVRDVNFDLILLDIMMPGMDGYEVCRRLKDNPGTTDVPVIFLTARTDTESIVRGFEVGGVDYITKPFEKAELLARVKTHLKLRQAYTRLRELNAAKDKFFSIIAHDLRDPFNALIGGFDLLLLSYDRLSEDKKKEYLDMMKATAYNTLNLLNNLLAWSGVRTGRLVCNPEIIHIRNIVNGVLLLLNKNAVNKNIRLTSLIREYTSAYADRNMTTTVIRNLVSNAVKYTKEGGSIVIDAEEHGEFWEISISDTGIGISPENIEKLFRIDIRYSTPGTAEERGTGLGLNLCKELVERNGGKIGVISEAGKGSRFYFTCSKAENRKDKVCDEPDIPRKHQYPDCG
jgi:signal transduction histidine kinase